MINIVELDTYCIILGSYCLIIILLSSQPDTLPMPNMFVFEWVSVRTPVWKFLCLCVLYCIHCRTSYVISLLVCFSESTCIKVCMIVFLVLYIVVRLILFHYAYSLLLLLLLCIFYICWGELLVTIGCY